MLAGLREQVLRFRSLAKEYAQKTGALERKMGALEQMLATNKQRETI